MEDETSSSSLPKGSAADGEQMELDQQNPQIETKPAVQILNEFLDHIETDVKKQIYQEGSEKLSSSSSAAIVDGDHRHRMTEKEADEQLLLLQQNTSSDNGPFIFEKTPPYIKNGALREYQIRGLNWLIQLQHNGINGILADEMGLGKTLQTISVLGFIKHYKRHNGPFLIIAHKSKLQNWENEFKRWCPTITTCTLIGDEKACNKIIQEEIQSYKFEALITSYEMALKSTKILKKFMWRYLVIDEAHSTKNERRRLFEIVRLMKSKNRLLITGTQPQNNLHELWALLKFLLPEKFASTEQFDSMFADDTVLGNENQDLLVKRLHKILQLFLLRRLKSDVEKSLLPKKELLLKMGMSNMQHERYNKIMKDLEESGKVEKKQLMSILMQLRKCTNHPYLFDGAEQGPPYTTDKHLVDNCGKMVLLDKLLIRLKEKGSRVLIFSSMSRMLDILEDFCWWRRYSYCRLDGNTAHEERQRLIDAFNVPNSEKFIFMLTKMVDGLDINLAAADVAIFYDSDSNPQVDLRAIDRTHRNSSDKQVQVFRLITENTPEERMIEKAEKERCLGRNGIQRMSLSEDDEDDMLAMIRPPDDEMDLILKRAEEQTKEFKKRLEKQASTNGAEEAEDKRSLTPFEVEKANRIQRILDSWERRVFHISGNKLLGSCVLINERRVLTAAHLSFTLHKSYEIKGIDKRSFSVQCEFICKSRDFAILQSNELPNMSLPTDNLRRGDKYFIMGYPSGVDASKPTITKGIIEGFMDDYIHLVGTPGSKRGYSGAPVFNCSGDLAGLLLGAVTGLSVNTTIQECLDSSAEQKYARILEIRSIIARHNEGNSDKDS